MESLGVVRGHLDPDEGQTGLESLLDSILFCSTTEWFFLSTSHHILLHGCKNTIFFWIVLARHIIWCSTGPIVRLNTETPLLTDHSKWTAQQPLFLHTTPSHSNERNHFLHFKVFFSILPKSSPCLFHPLNKVDTSFFDFLTLTLFKTLRHNNCHNKYSQNIISGVYCIDTGKEWRTLPSQRRLNRK